MIKYKKKLRKKKQKLSCNLRLLKCSVYHGYTYAYRIQFGLFVSSFYSYKWSFLCRCCGRYRVIIPIR